MKYFTIGIVAAVILAAVLFIWKVNPFREDRKMSNDIIEMVKNKSDIILLDVRTPEEHRERRIPDSILLPDYEVEARIDDVVPDRDATIVVYCRSGRRSAAAAKVLKDLGYENVFDLGGINTWPYETISGE